MSCFQSGTNCPDLLGFEGFRMLSHIAIDTIIFRPLATCGESSGFDWIFFQSHDRSGSLNIEVGSSVCPSGNTRGSAYRYKISPSEILLMLSSFRKLLQDCFQVDQR